MCDIRIEKMSKTVKEIIENWKEKYPNSIMPYNEETINGIAFNCLSLTETWLQKIKERDKISFVLKLIPKNSNTPTNLYGVTSDNISDEIFLILLSQADRYAAMSLEYHTIENGVKNIKVLGELTIS